MRWECGQVRVTRLREGSNCAGVQRCQVCAPINRQTRRHTDTQTHTNAHAHAHVFVFVHARVDVDADVDTRVHVHVYVYVFVHVFVLETATRSKKKKRDHCGRSQAKIFSTAQDSTAASDGTGEGREDTHFAITEKILILSAQQLCM